MPVYRVQAPDGSILRIEGPEGATPAQLQDQARLYFESKSERKLTPSETTRRAGQMALEGMSGLDKFRAGMGKAMTDLVRGAGQLVGAYSDKDATEAKQRDAALMDSGAGLAGNIVGNVAAAAPAMFVPGANTIAGATLLGGGFGALQPVAEGESRLTNTALGAAGGAVGQAGGQAFGRVIRPVRPQIGPQQAALAQAAQARGIPLDAADITGSKPLTTIRDVLANLPLTADRQAGIQGAKQTAFNRAVSATYGGADDAITPAALTSARNRIGQEFTNLAQRNTLQANQGLVQELGSIQATVNRYATPDVARIVNNNIDDILSKVEPGDVITGRAYRELDSQLGRLSRNSSSGDVRNYLGEVRSALRKAMDQSISPADSQAWKEARKQYANLMTVAPLAARDEAGDVSGRALLAAVNRQNRTNLFSGGGDLGELGRIGRSFIAEQTPNSGTAQRTFFQNFLTNPISAAWNQGLGGISYPVQTMLNSPAGQQYLTQGLLQLTPRQQDLINMLARSSGAGLLTSANAAQ